MTLSGGIAQGTGGGAVEINSTIPMYNVGKSDGERLLKAAGKGEWHWFLATRLSLSFIILFQ